MYRNLEGQGGDILKLDDFLSRSLFDLYSNIAIFLNDQVNCDENQQHDSRLQEGVNAQYLRPFTLFGQRALMQNYFKSRLRPGDPSLARIYATPGYPVTVTVGLTFLLFGK